MGFFEVAEARHSVRAFQKRPVEEEKLKKILAGVYTVPTAGDLKAYDVTVVRDSGQRKKLAEAALGQLFIAEAPIVLVFSANKVKSARRYVQRACLYSLQDATIACTFAMLGATQLGLGSCWVGAFDEQAVASILDLASGLRPVALLPIGYARE